MIDIKIGNPTPHDYDQVTALLEAHHLPLAGLSDHRDNLVVASEGESVIGSACLEVYGQAALLRSVAVDPSRQRTGMGRRIIARTIDHARNIGINELYLLTETAADYFPRFGFEPISRSDVSPSVQQSIEFTEACPASAVAMRLGLENPIG
jgi:amino-acid N-acetyltransferase